MAIFSYNKSKGCLSLCVASLFFALAFTLFLSTSVVSALPLESETTPSPVGESSLTQLGRRGGNEIDTSPQALATYLSETKTKLPVDRMPDNRISLKPKPKGIQKSFYDFTYRGTQMSIRETSSLKNFPLAGGNFIEKMLYRIGTVPHKEGSILQQRPFTEAAGDLWYQLDDIKPNSKFIYKGFILQQCGKSDHAVLPLPDTTLASVMNQFLIGKKKTKPAVSKEQIIVHMQDLFRGIQQMLDHKIGTEDIMIRWAFVTINGKNDITMKWARFDRLTTTFKKTRAEELRMESDRIWKSPEEQRCPKVERCEYDLGQSMIYRAVWIALYVLVMPGGANFEQQERELYALRKAIYNHIYPPDISSRAPAPSLEQILQEYFGAEGDFGSYSNGKLGHLKPDAVKFFANTLCEGKNRWPIETIVDKWPKLLDVIEAQKKLPS